MQHDRFADRDTFHRLRSRPYDVDVPDRMSSSTFHAAFDLADWRILLRRIESTFPAPTFDAATAFAHDVARAAEEVGHHPDIDIRYPGVVHIALTTHAVDGLTELDADLAATISRLAAEAGLHSEPTRSQSMEIAIDALHIDRVLPFWRAVLGYVDEPPSSPEAQVDALVDPLRIGPPVWFQQMDEPRPQRNRIHLDITVPAEVAEERIAQALDAGGTLVSDSRAPAFWVLADAEGNEACICTWQDRD